MTSTNSKAQALFEEFAGIKRAMQGSRGKSFGDLNLTRPQIETIFVITHQPRQTIGELAAAMGITNGAATQLVEGLVKRELVERTPDTHDRRVTHVSATAAGKGLAADMRRRHGAFMSKLLEGLSEEDMEQLVSLMRKVRTTIEANQEKEGKN